ncbi:helix-turn-helix domain-containing protein [Akkermansiaceae bacterium]|nr:helix-turn-helix domain-containing protein [Akkermansiaceae bacterium]MDB4706482.1 helix-turn-helix domain-containing protein [Akkermansiaceae bacterium]
MNAINHIGFHDGATSNTSTSSPQWLRVEQVQALYGLSRSKVFELIREGQVIAASLLSPGKSRGVRLISRESLDELISASITTSNKEGQE